MKAANACGNNEGGIPGGNKRRNIARLRAFCGEHCSIALKAVKKLVDRCKRRAIRGAIPFEWAGGGRLEKAACALKRRNAV